MSIPTPDEFEDARLALFHEQGFEGRSRRLVDATGRTTYAIERPGAGPPRVLVHGGLADASVWYRMAGSLSGHVVVIDRPGCGLSDPVDYTGVDYRRAAADWLASVADGLGAPSIDVIGNSMGGYFSIAFALAHPTRARHLVLAGAPAGLDRPLPLFLRLVGTPLAHLLLAFDIQDPETMRARILADMLARPERISVRAIEIALSNAHRPASKLAVRTMLANVTDLGGWRRELMLREPMRALGVSTLFLWGANDNFAPVSSGQELAKAMSLARVELVEDAGHLPQIDQPAVLAAHIERFLADGLGQLTAAA